MKIEHRIISGLVFKFSQEKMKTPRVKSIYKNITANDNDNKREPRGKH